MWNFIWTGVTYLKYEKTASFLLKCNQKKGWFVFLTAEILSTEPTKASRWYFASSAQEVWK